jgi:hypothetical protein
MSTPADVVPDDLILAAVERAVCHERPWPDESPAAARWVIMEHLDIPTRSGRARRVKARLGVLVEDGLLERSRRHSLDVWALTPAGRRRLARARRTGVLELPESPQHRMWRNERTLAGQEIERLRENVRRHAENALWLLDPGGLVDPEMPGESDAWFEIAEKLQESCRVLGSAVYCLNEWAEPDDAHADIDDGIEPDERGRNKTEQARLATKRRGRRSISVRLARRR